MQNTFHPVFAYESVCQKFKHCQNLMRLVGIVSIQLFQLSPLDKHEKGLEYQEDVFEARATFVLVGAENTRAAVASRRDGSLAPREPPLVCVASFTNSVLFLPGDNMLSLRIPHPLRCPLRSHTSRLVTVILWIFFVGLNVFIFKSHLRPKMTERPTE